MRNRSLKYLFVTLMALLAETLFAQSPLHYLESTFPRLTEIYKDDIDKSHAHYVFAIDVSGSMNAYEPTMVPLLKNFIQALPNGDKVTVIPFGTEIKNPMGFSGIISNEMKSTLCSNMERLYRNPNYDQLFCDHTNIYKAINGISNAVITNSEYKVNILIPLTDFLNNIPKVPPHQFNKRRLTAEELSEMRSQLASAIKGSYVRCVAVELGNETENRQQKEFCLDQLQNNVFDVAENGLEIVSTNNSKEAIEQWFEQLRRDILVVKLRSIIDSENKAGKVRMSTKMDIDGNTISDITWSPNRLYSKIKIDSTFLRQQGFVFVNDTTNYQTMRDTVLHLELGQAKHQNYGFHYLNDSLSLGISLPTDFDSELEKLGISKPLSSTNTEENQWIFTFFLPFWITCLAVFLIILYIILAIRAASINAKEKMSGKIVVSDATGGEIFTKKVAECDKLTIGKSADIRVDDAEWTLCVTKVKPSPLLLFKKPYFEWSATKGYVGSKMGTTGCINTRNDNLLKVSCGGRKSDITHKVSLRLNTK